jgi:hypothetical protein
MTRLLAAAVAVLISVSAQDPSPLTGKFQGTTPNGAQLTLDLTATDTTVSGTLTRNEETVRITDGKVKGKAFTFKATVGDQAESFAGELAGSDVKVWLERRGPESAVTLTRAKQ